jgi:hypothetical protein
MNIILKLNLGERSRDENVDNDVLDSVRISLIVLLVWFVLAKKMIILGRRTLLDINFFSVISPTSG